MRAMRAMRQCALGCCESIAFAAGLVALASGGDKGWVCVCGGGSATAIELTQMFMGSCFVLLC